jgi:hypothetical protein
LIATATAGSVALLAVGGVVAAVDAAALDATAGFAAVLAAAGADAAEAETAGFGAVV